jgi:hypothetical protein
MAPLTPRDIGFTAELRVNAVLRSTRRRRSRAIAFAVVIASIALGLMLLPGAEEEAASETSNSQQSVVPVEYKWRVYVLNQTSMSDSSNGTTFSFRTEDLPQDFGSILFGDFRSDQSGEGTYYGGCGILVEASGTSASIVLRETDGKFISSVAYNGQDPVVFSGERRSVSYPSVTTSYYGTDLIIQDWRNGTWAPDEGILVEHPEDVTMVASEFCLMLFEPEGDIEIPEFGDFTTVIVLAVGALTILTRRSLGKTK